MQSSQTCQKMKDPSLLLNLPPKIAIDILSRLPIQTMARCKCVCKSLFQLLETRYFVKSHLFRSAPGLILYQNHTELLRVFEFEDGLELERHELHYVPVTKFERKAFTTRPDAYIYLNAEGSANGFLYLRELPGDVLYICNPITREYISLPNPKGNPIYPNIIVDGFGVSKTTDQYKVVRIYQERVLDSECYVYTLGTGSWRSVPIDPFHKYDCSFNNVFLNGNIHWLVSDFKGSPKSLLISCFDLETELFKTISPPPYLSGSRTFYGDLAVLRDCLCLSDATSENENVIWIMKEYGVEKSWTKEFVIIRPPYHSDDLYYPLKVFNDGDILLLCDDLFMFYYSSKANTVSEVDMFKTQKLNSHSSTRLHNSSFLSLKSFAMENVVKF